MKFLKKIFVTFILIFTFSILNSYAEVVDKIEVDGNERISLETIVIFGDISVGKNYESSDINLLIKKLYETTFFSKISINLENNILKIVVKENPIVDSIVLDGEKADKYKDQIQEQLSIKEKGSFIESYIKKDLGVLKEFYRMLGYYFVNIEVEIEKLKNNRVNLIFKIDKGEKAKIAKIYFLGDKKIRDKKLRDVITSQEATFWKFLSRNVYLAQERVQLDKRLLENFYKNKGYYEVDITSSNVEYSEGEGFVLTYSINAGKRYRFKKIFANVSEALDQSAFVSLEKDFNKLVGNYYSQRELNELLEKIDKLSERKELQFINHNILETLDGEGVEVKINIFEGEKFIIERINIVGNSITNDSVIRGELIVDEGDPFSTLLINKSINRIKGRDIFGIVEHKITQGSSKDLRVLEISVTEKATGEIMAGAGVGTDGTSFQFAVKENNWLGRGINLNSELNLSTEKVSGRISIINPNYNFTNNAVQGALDVSSTDRSTNSGYKSSRTGLNLGTSFEQYEDIFIAPEILFSYEDIEVDSSANASVKKMDGTFLNTDFAYGIILDKRNQVFQPTEGYRAKFTQRLPLIQDSSAISNGIDYSVYHDFSDDIIGTLKFYGKTIHGVDGDVRLTNRLYIPKNRLRGFDTYQTGPKDGTDYVGGNYVSALGVEAQLPNLLPESYRTDFSVFLDTGNVWSVDYDDSVDDSNKIRSSIGVAANVFTTIGPLSFTLAQSITKHNLDETETFNFRLGTSF